MILKETGNLGTYLKNFMEVDIRHRLPHKIEDSNTSQFACKKGGTNRTSKKIDKTRHTGKPFESAYSFGGRDRSRSNVWCYKAITILLKSCQSISMANIYPPWNNIGLIAGFARKVCNRKAICIKLMFVLLYSRGYRKIEKKKIGNHFIRMGQTHYAQFCQQPIPKIVIKI